MYSYFTHWLLEGQVVQQPVVVCSKLETESPISNHLCNTTIVISQLDIVHDKFHSVHFIIQNLYVY